MPRVLISDRDPHFTGKFWQALFKILSTKLAMSSAYHPQTDGQTERANRTLEGMLRAFVNVHQTDWDTLLPTIEFVYNNSKQASTGFSPFFLNFGQDPLVPDALFTSPNSNVPSTSSFLSTLSSSLQEAKTHLLVAQNCQKQYADKHRRDLSFVVGDQVMLSSHSLPLPLASQVR